jgi:hypothetical protein
MATVASRRPDLESQPRTGRPLLRSMPNALRWPVQGLALAFASKVADCEWVGVGEAE